MTLLNYTWLLELLLNLKFRFQISRLVSQRIDRVRERHDRPHLLGDDARAQQQTVLKHLMLCRGGHKLGLRELTVAG